MAPYVLLGPPLEQVRPAAAPSDAVDGVLQIHAHQLEPVAPDLSESVRALPRYSRFPVWSLNTRLGFPRQLAHMRFRAVVLHYSVFYSGLGPLTAPFREWLGRTARSAYVIAQFQDEQSYTRAKLDICDELSVDSVFTCLQQPEAREVYGRHTSVPRAVTYHPGYVSEGLIEAAARFGKPDEARTIDVGYRGRRAPAHWGEAAAEKWQIGVEFRRRAAGLGLALDIEVEEGARIYGDAWYRFMGDCRATLGTESGASRLDLEGVVPAEANETARLRSVDVETTPVKYRAISPRHLEAAAFRCCQVLFEGEYAGVLDPDVHYIPLRKDFSNLPEVIDRLRDAPGRRAVAERARRDLVDSGELSYARFVHAVDEELTAAGVEGSADRAEVAARLYPPRPVRHARRAWLAARHAPFPGRSRLASALRGRRRRS